MIDKNDVVIAIAGSLYASRATDDKLRAEPLIEEIVNEAWDLYYNLERAVRTSNRRHAEGGTPLGRAERPDGG